MAHHEVAQLLNRQRRVPVDKEDHALEQAALGVAPEVVELLVEAGHLDHT